MPASLHTKYRPKTFDQILGHREIVRSFRRVLRKREQHTFLLVGPSGCGKTTLARIAARELGCQGGNLVEIDAATHTGVDEMRRIMDLTQYSPMSGGMVRCFIIDEVHRLSLQAWESLLKSLEEPPEHVFWFLCTTNRGKVPVTIQTRSVTYNLKPIGDDPIRQLLLQVVKAERFETSEQVLDLIVERANGSPRQALVLLAAVGSETNRKRAARLLETAVDSPEVVDLCRYLLSDKPKTWSRLAAYFKSLEQESGESVRQIVLAYMTKVALSTSSDRAARRPLMIMDALSAPCESGAKIQPIMVALGALVLHGGYR
jgi:DNA polymerase III subunit gamma/tau